MVSHCLPASYMAEKRERGTDLEIKRELLGLLGVAFASFLIHGGVGLDHIGGHTRALVTPCESGVYDGGGSCDLPCARGSRIPHFGGGIHRGVCGVL
jgi:hypothetical protein